MFRPLTRKLSVRDDGTGKSRDTATNFAEFEDEDAIILLGDPGMGKTTFFKDAANENYTTVRNFLIDPHLPLSEPIFLDALDEYRAISGGQDVTSEVAKALISRKRPKFRLSCRAADWFGSTDQEALRVTSASGRVVVLELCPLSRDEILDAVKDIVPNPLVFLDETDLAGLGGLLGNPQTLELLARAWASNKRPQNKFEAFEIGVFELLKEVNPGHTRRGANSLDLNELRKAAGAAASILLLSNSVGLSRADTVEANGLIRLSLVPYPNIQSLDASLKRRIFISPAVDRFEPIHRTIAEFLAAEDLAERISIGLPIDRVMALICGIDGRPVSSLRGLFAWLMCRLGHLAEEYVGLDPYGVVTYGDASVLPPAVQGAIWSGLRQLGDPWFLTNREESASFRGLANLNTADIIRDLLADPATGIHLKISLLEAIASSTEDIGLKEILRETVLNKIDNTWIRSVALKAFVSSVGGDWTELKAIDHDLLTASNDFAAPEIRTDLLNLSRGKGKLPQRLLSILKQAAHNNEKRDVIGRFYSLIDLPLDSDLNEILDGISQELATRDEFHFEFRRLFDEWLTRRLKNPNPITPEQLSCWLRPLQVRSDRLSKKALGLLKKRFEQESTLFQEVFEILAHTVPDEEKSFWAFLAHYLWELLPMDVWPVPPYEFFLMCALEEKNPEWAGDLFQMFLIWFPTEGGSVALAEAGFDFVAKRNDVAQTLGDWRSCKIEEWRRKQWERQEKESRKELENRLSNVSYLTPRLATIRKGVEERVLAWAAVRYLGLLRLSRDIPDARERLVSLTNEEIADAFLEGFVRYIENSAIPKKEAIIESWLENSIPHTHILLGLSVYLRFERGMDIPAEALPQCIAAVVDAYPGDRMPRYRETLSKWLVQQTDDNPAILKSTLMEIWILSTRSKKRGDLPGYYELSKNLGSIKFLTSLSAGVLSTGVKEDDSAVTKLASVLMSYDKRATLAIGEAELAREGLSAEVRAIWTTVLFVIEPSTYSEPWKNLMLEPNAAVWEAIDIIRGDRIGKKETVSLTAAQRAEVIATLGRLFENVRHPSGGWSGSRNPWDATEFIANQLRLLAADGSVDVSAHLERLEKDERLESYLDLIRHHKADHQKKLRESSFVFALPEQISAAIRNQEPATPSDLLAFIVDHLNALSRELGRTQKERYRAYWNEEGRKLTTPKREEICSGLLAEDLQNRVRSQGLIVTVEYHMAADKECDIVVLQGTKRLLPIEVKHHYHKDLWTAWRIQLDHLYTREANAGGLGIYLVFWSGETKGRTLPKIPDGIERPTSAIELRSVLGSLIPEKDRFRLRVIVLDISGK